MHFRGELQVGLLIFCCTGLVACTASAPKGPVATVTVPKVGKPVPPASAQAALSSEAFTPYAALGASTDDGLAPGDTYDALHTACMNAAGYGQYASDAPYGIRANRGLAFAQPTGPWGYLGTALAAQDGFAAQAGPGSGGGPPPGPLSPSSLPQAVQVAAGKCANIVLGFNDAMFNGALAIVETMNNDIGNDVANDAAIRKATTVWSACMAKNGYTSSDPDALAQQEQTDLGLRFAVVGSAPVTPTAAQNAAQIAEAVADANCTTSSDLAGIFYAVQASYEQQLVNANQQALNIGVRQYKAAFARELSKLPALLRTTSAKLQFPGRPVPGAKGPRPDQSPAPSKSAKPAKQK
jgi:hypothetical protein